MKITKLVCTLAVATVCVFVATGCGGHKPGKLTQLPGHTPLAPPDIGPGRPLGGGDNPGGGALPGPETGVGKQDRATLAAYTVHFAYDSAAIKKSERSSLQAVAEAMKRDSSVNLLIEGNCDERGTEEYNRSLGERRALAARKELVRMGVPAMRVTTKSFGKDNPADPGHDESAWSKNRRDDFVLVQPGQGGTGGMGGS